MTAALNSACCPSPRAGGPPDCSKIKAAASPSPKAAAHRLMVWGPVPAPPPYLGPSPRANARRRASVPAPSVSAPGSSSGARPWHPSPIVRETSLSLSPISNPSLTTQKANPVTWQIYPMLLRISPWLWFRSVSYPWCGEIWDELTSNQQDKRGSGVPLLAPLRNLR